MADRYTLSGQAVERLRRMASRQFGGKTSSRPVPTRRRFYGGGGITRILIIETIPAAEWDPETQELTPQTFTAKTWQDAGDGKWTYTSAVGEGEIEAKSYYVTTVVVGDDKGRVGYVMNGELIAADCAQLDLSGGAG